MTLPDILLWGALPYVVLAVLVTGTIWRWRYDQFGWTTRSSQLYESRLLRLGSPLFHFGILVVLVGHIIGLVVPRRWTSAAGLSQEAYHVQAIALGGVAGASALVGVAILVYRRRTTGPVFTATTRNDKAMYVVLVAAIVAGLATTLLGATGGEAYNYRLTVSPWFRSLFWLHPDIAAMSRSGLGLPDPHADRHAVVRLLAVHPAGARLQRPGRIPVPALRRLPLPSAPHHQPAPAGRAGAADHPGRASSA